MLSLPYTANTAVSPTTTSSWYLASTSAQLQSTFEQSLSDFEKKLASNSTKRAWISNLKATRLQDVVNEVAKVQAHYNRKKTDSKLQNLIVSFSHRVAYYGKVLDVMVQHHPEYVSLAWGSLKLIFGAIIEHERLGSTIVTALNDIGEALSRLDLAEALYPTDKMKETIVILNCHIITFLCRALDWYESSTLSRAFQSIGRPAALRYDDLIEEIKKTLSKVADLSAAGSQAEQRDMHDEMRLEQDAQRHFRILMQSRLDEMQHQLNELVRHEYARGDLKAVHQQIQGLTSLVRQISRQQVSSEQALLQEMIVMKQDIQSTQADIHHQLSDVQFNQAVSFISSKCAINYKVTYEAALSLRKVRRVSSGKCAPFWDSRQLQSWDQSTLSASIVLTSSFRDRLNVRDFYVSAIEQLLLSHIPVFWIIQQEDQKHNIFEVLKSLISQAINNSSPSQTDVHLSSRIRAFDAAHSVEDYTDLLVENLAYFKLIYIIVDANAISFEILEECREIFWKVSELLRARNQDTVLKVMLTGHGLSRNPSGAGKEAIIKVVQTSKRKSKRVPQAPLKGRARLVPLR